jgi:hypothetical protein
MNMDSGTICDQIASATGGYVLGLLTAVWIHSLWRWWHPQNIRFWGTWDTDPRRLTYCGLTLLIVWIAFLLKSFG